MRLHLGPPPEDPGFQPEAQGWHSIREPGPLLVQVIALPVALAVFLVLGIAVTRLSGSNIIKSVISIEAVLWLIVLIPLHELLHVFAQPGAGLTRRSIIGVWFSRAVIYASYLGSMDRARFVVCLAAPFVVLTLLPLLGMALLNAASINGGIVKHLGLLSLLNGIASSGDLVGLGLILAQVPRAATLQDKGWRTYWKLSLLILPLLFVSCSGLPARLETPASVDGPVEAWYQVYFTDPADPEAGSYRGGPDADLAAAINQARLSVDAAFDTLDLWSLRDALIEAHRRGVTVRVVVESDNLDVDEIQDLLAAGIPLLGDRREGMMHNKFMILDRREVWTGSMNFTVSGSYTADNNLLRLRSPLLVEDYLTEFEEMYEADRFGPGSPANTPHPRFQEQGVQLEVYFSPDDGVASEITRLIRGAKQDISFLAFSFTSDEIANAMLESLDRGVIVKGVFDASQYGQNTGTEYDRLKEAGAEVRLDGNPGSMHHKVIILDDSTVITGSYNFSRNAEERNDENTLVIHSPEMARLYLEEFERVFEQAR
jgi:hypothetical protein